MELRIGVNIYYSQDAAMSDQNLDYAAISRNVEKRLARQKWQYRIGFFVAHALFFVVAMLVVLRTVAIDPQLRDVLYNSGSGASIIVFLPFILWTAVLLFHVASLYFESSAGEKVIRKQLLMHEVGEDMLRKGYLGDGMVEKPKRRAAELETKRMQLSDDGELVSVDDEQHLEQPDYSVRSKHAGSA
jgi:hypothetical protein